ncbi:MAG: glutamine-hydrolyzing GMP synthase, partial [Bdellovibrionales bacterium]|nr:glutamine-hydrolyzing GMP synthase [Bdellovibrionales bacterium]
MQAQVLVLDFGSQFTQLIARRVRELGVYSEIRACTTKPDQIDRSGLKAIVLSGGPASVTSADAPVFDEQWLETGIPVLGICYGMQLIANHFGAELVSGASREYGYSTCLVQNNTTLFDGFEKGENTPIWMSHGDHVESIPNGFDLLGSSPGAPHAAIGCDAQKIFGVQFHVEVAHTPRGKDILGNFLFKIADCRKDWTSSGFISESVKRISREVSAGGNVICGLSGGVDSTVAAVLVAKALGDRLHCIFVDNGLLRKDEKQQVMQALSSAELGLQITAVDGESRFLSALKGVSDPEEKRKIIGRVFIEVFEEQAEKIDNVTHLVQGTLYPDVIESVSVRGPSATIKTHHNVGGLPERMNLKLIEPLRELFKDEVRRIGGELAIPVELLNRQPFPGPGLAVRILGDITPERLKILREADQIFHDEIAAEGLYHSLWQSFAVLLPIQSVGVMG